MTNRRTLSLKREVLQEITATDLKVVGGAAQGTTETMYSCLAYVTCDILHCYAENTILCVN